MDLALSLNALDWAEGEIMNKQELLEQINAELANRDLKALRELGDASQGEIEVISIHAFHDYNARFFTDVEFGVVFPGGAVGRYTIRFNANGATSDGAIMVTVINGRLAMVRSHRLTVGRYIAEFPRGFGEKIDNASVNGELGTLKIGDLPLGTAVRELGEEVVSRSRVVNITHLGNFAQNTGTSTATPAYYLVIMQVDEDVLRKRMRELSDEGHKLVLWTLDDVQKRIGTDVVDSHTLTGLLLYKMHREMIGA